MNIRQARKRHRREHASVHQLFGERQKLLLDAGLEPMAWLEFLRTLSKDRYCTFRCWCRLQQLEQPTGKLQEIVG